MSGMDQFGCWQRWLVGVLIWLRMALLIGVVGKARIEGDRVGQEGTVRRHAGQIVDPVDGNQLSRGWLDASSVNGQSRNGDLAACRRAEKADIPSAAAMPRNAGPPNVRCYSETIAAGVSGLGSSMIGALSYLDAYPMEAQGGIVVTVSSSRNVLSSLSKAFFIALLSSERLSRQ